jgi:hypothetical protein
VRISETLTIVFRLLLSIVVAVLKNGPTGRIWTGSVCATDLRFTVKLKVRNFKNWHRPNYIIFCLKFLYCWQFRWLGDVAGVINLCFSGAGYICCFFGGEGGMAPFYDTQRCLESCDRHSVVQLCEHRPNWPQYEVPIYSHVVHVFDTTAFKITRGTRPPAHV